MINTQWMPMNHFDPAKTREQLLWEEIVSLRQEIARLRGHTGEVTQESLPAPELSQRDWQMALERFSQSMNPFELMLEAIPVAVFVSRVCDHQILYSNPMGCLTLGVNKPALLGCQFLDFYADPAEKVILEEMMRTEICVQNYEVQLQRADGSLFWGSLSHQPFEFEGEATILTVLEDITARKATEQEVQKAKEQLQAVLDAVPGPVSWIHADGYYLGVNQQLAKACNLSPEDFIGQELGFLKGSSQFSELMYQFLAQPENSIAQVVELPSKAGEGKRYYLIAAQKYDRGQAAVSVGIDITERKQAEEKLRIAEENYRSIFENALEGIFQYTPEGCFISVNPAMARLYGDDSPEEMMTRVTSIDQIYVDARYRDEFRRRIEVEGTVQKFESQVYRQDGSIIWVSESTRAVRNFQGEVLYYEGIVEDITQRKQEEEALKQQVKALKIEIDRSKQAEKVAEIVGTDSFQDLKQKLERMKRNRQKRK